MTNSYSLSQLPRIVFFQGLNKNTGSFDLFIKYFKDLGFETDLIVLPGHGDNRKEASNFKEALTAFDQSMKRLKGVPYHAIAFSQGALYLQLWLEKNQGHKPLKQVLLAPALFIHRQSMIKKILKVLPSFVVIKSLAPKVFRRYEALNVAEYRTLLEGILLYQKISGPFKLPTLVLIDPKDELVDARKLGERFPVQFLERPYLKKGKSCHHILFHPEYFEGNDWESFTMKICSFLK